MPIGDSIARLHARIRGGHHALHLRSLAGGALRAVTLAAGVVWLALVAGVAARQAPALLGPLAALAAVALAGVLALCLVRPLWRAPRRLRYAAWVEERVPALRSRLVNALELSPAVSGAGPLPGDASRELAAALIADTERSLAAVDLAGLAPSPFPRLWRRAAVAVAAVWMVSLALGRGPLFDAGWALLHPAQAAGGGVRLEVWPGDVTLAPGSDLVVEARVRGGALPVLETRLGETAAEVTMRPGAAPGAPAPAEGGERFWARVTAVASAGEYRVRALDVASPAYRVALLGRAAPMAFEIRYDYPAYTGRAAEVQSAPSADLVALAGTRARVSVLLDRDAGAVSWTLASALERESPRRWTGSTTLGGNREFEIAVRDGQRERRHAYRIEVIPDQPPVLTVLEPERNLDLPAGQQVPLAIAATDDYGLTDWSLVWRRESGAEERGVLGRFAGAPRETQATATWDLSPLGLLPGQEVTFFLEVRDNDRVNGPKATRSAPLVIRFPLLSEIYEDIEAEHATAAEALERARRDAEELSRQVEDANRELDRRRPGRQAGSSWEKEQAAREIAERQQQISDRLEQVQQGFERAAREAAEHDAFRQEILAKMQEIARLLREIESPELRDAMQRLQEAIEKTDRRGMEEAMRQLEWTQKEMLENLERTRAVLEQVRREERLDAAARRAEELARRQDALNREMQSAKSESERRELAAEQERRGEEAEALRQEVEALARELEQHQRPQAAEASRQAAEEMEREAEPRMDQARRELQEGRPAEARRSGERARESLSKAASQLSEASQQMGNQGNQEQLAAVRRAAQDLVSLSQRQEELSTEGTSGRERAQWQKDLQQGAEQVEQDLREAAKDTPFLDSKAGRRLDEAVRRLSRSSQAFEQGNPGEGERQSGEAATALNEAVIALRDTEQSMCQGQNPGQGSNGRAQLQQMIGQQTELNRDTQSLAERLSRQQRLLASDQQSLQEMAARQEAIRRGIEEALQQSREGDVLGDLDAAQREMEEVSRRLAREELDRETMERQNRILSRLLDAQRSVNRREFREERESHAGREVERNSPAALTREQMGAPERARHDLLRSQAERYAPEYRSLVEAYLRRLQESP
jgi:hypothetical protein